MTRPVAGDEGYVGVNPVPHTIVAVKGDSLQVRAIVKRVQPDPEEGRPYWITRAAWHVERVKRVSTASEPDDPHRYRVSWQ